LGIKKNILSFEFLVDGVKSGVRFAVF